MELSVAINASTGFTTFTVDSVNGTYEAYIDGVITNISTPLYLEPGLHKVKLVDNNSFVSKIIMVYSLEEINQDSSWTASFSFDTNSWVSFHDYKPNYIWSTSIDVFACPEEHVVYLHNKGHKGLIYNKIEPSKIIFRERLPQNAKFESLEWRTIVKDYHDIPIYNQTFTSCRIWDAYGATVLKKLTTENKEDKYVFMFATIQNNAGVWSYNDLSRETVYDRRPLFGRLQNFKNVKQNIETLKGGETNYIGDELFYEFTFDNNTNYDLRLYSTKTQKNDEY